MSSLRKEFANAVAAGEAAIRINTDEISDALKSLTEVCKSKGWELQVWDETVGVEWFTTKPSEDDGPSADTDPFSQMAPPTALAELTRFLNVPAHPDPGGKIKSQTDDEGGDVKVTILVMKNFHLAFERGRGPIVSAIQHIVSDRIEDHPEYKKLEKGLYAPYGISGNAPTGKFIVGLMPAEANLYPEVSPLFKVINHELPDIEELQHILSGIVISSEEGEQQKSDPIPPEERIKICKFALGLTRFQAEGVFATSLVKFGRVVPSYVWEEKSKILNKEGLVELYQGKETFNDVAGLEGAKDLVQRLLTTDKVDENDPDVRARGVLLVGGPGVGKTLLAKAAGNEMGLPTLMVHPGNWMGSLVGESEAKTRKGFQILKAHAPCIAIVD